MNDNERNQSDEQSGRSDAEGLKNAAAELRESVQSSARDAGQRIAAEAHSRATGAKSSVAEEISSVSRALRTASEELRHGSPQERTFGMMASNLADFAEVIREKDLSELVDEMSGFARRNPVAFLGGAALLGFAGVRMAKASRRARLSDDDPYGIRTVPSAGTSTKGSREQSVPSDRTEGGLA
jgi:hypothetical protein